MAYLKSEKQSTSGWSTQPTAYHRESWFARYDRLIIIHWLMLLISWQAGAQVISPGHLGKLESGDGATPYLSVSFSTVVSGNFAFVIGNGTNKLEIVDITNSFAPVHKSSYTLVGLPNCLAVSGNYVYVAIYGTTELGALEIVDISDPSNPVQSGIITDGDVSTLPSGAQSTANLQNPLSMSLKGTFVYLACQVGNNIQIVDVSNPRVPIARGGLADGQGGALLLNPISIFASGNYVYVGSQGKSAIEIVDVTDPDHPVHKASIVDGSVLGGSATTPPFLKVPSSLFVEGNYAYVLSSFADYLEVLDVSNPANPTHKGSLKDGLGNVPYLALGNVQPGAKSIFVKGNYAYICSPESNALEVVDISNPSLPLHAGSLLDGAGGAKLNSPQCVFIIDNYAYVTSALSNALEIVDISNPSSPVHRSSLDNGSGGALLSGAKDVFVSGKYAYVVSLNSNALQVVDISKPTTPVSKGFLLDGNGSAPYLNQPSSIYVVGNYAYIVSYNSGMGSLEIVDISNPTAPVHKGSLLDGGLVPPYISNPLSIFVSGNYAYIASNFSNALEIIDVSNPAAPVHKGSIQRTNGAQQKLLRPYDLFVSGNYAYVTSTASNSLDIIDVSNPAAPVWKSSLQDGGGNAPYLSSPRSIFVSGSYAYIGSYGYSTLEVINISNPLSPVHAGSLKDGGGVAPFLKGPSSIFVAGTLAYVTSGGFNALEVVDVSNPTAPRHQSSLKDRVGGANLNSPSSIQVLGNYAYVSANYGNALEIIYLYSPVITNFSPVTGPVGTQVTITGQNFNTLIKADFNGTSTSTTGQITLSSVVVTVPVGATNGKISISEGGAPVSSQTNFIVTPTALPPTAIDQSSFTAAWSDVGSSKYNVNLYANNQQLNSYSITSVNGLPAKNYTVIEGLNSGVTYQYDVTSFSGNTPSSSSNRYTVVTLPQKPVAKPASLITETSFIAKWSSVPGAAGYYLDVVSADDSFTKNFLVGYNNLNVPGATDTSQYVTGLAPYTTYYYRVRAANISGQSASSNTMLVKTADVSAPVVSASAANSATITSGFSPTLNVTITDNVGIDSASILYRGVSEKSYKAASLQGPGGTGGNYSVVIEQSWLDAMGLEYYFIAIDEAGNRTASPVSQMPLVNSSLSLPVLPSGTSQNNYRIVAFPYRLSTDNNVTSVYNGVTWNDNTQAAIWWWDPTLKSSSGDYAQYISGGIKTIDPGKGYWILLTDPFTPQLTNVTAPNYNHSNLYSMTLKPKWNQIGNPYPVDISWDDVIAFNKTAHPEALFSSLSIFDGTGYKSATGDTKLKAFEGGFVKNLGSSDITIQIPFPEQTTSGGRRASADSKITEDTWTIDLHINQEGFTNQLGGFGMNREAQTGIDRFDNFNPPGFLGIPEINFVNEDFGSNSISRDVVTSQDKFVWQFKPKGKPGASSVLSWNQEAAKSIQKKIYLLDEEELRFTDLSEVNQYSFTLSDKSTFRLFYGLESSDQITSQDIVVGNPYPNPLRSDAQARIPIGLPEQSSEYQVSIQFYSAMGELIATSKNSLPAGIHQLDFNLSDNAPTGMLLYKLTITGEQSARVCSGKIVNP